MALKTPKCNHLTALGLKGLMSYVGYRTRRSTPWACPASLTSQHSIAPRSHRSIKTVTTCHSDCRHNLLYSAHWQVLSRRFRSETKIDHRNISALFVYISAQSIKSANRRLEKRNECVYPFNPFTTDPVKASHFAILV